MNHEEKLDFAVHGAINFRAAAGPQVSGLTAALAGLPVEVAGTRIAGIAALRPVLAAEGAIGRIASTAIGAGARPVRAILFNKTEAANWALGWHQDRTICVKQRCDTPGFGPWTIKSGMHHVAPPFELLARMVTLRIHLDDVADDNAPLLIAPGSHRMGAVPSAEAERVAQSCGIIACTAKAGDVWLYATPILHASAAAIRPKSRRVLQVDYAAEDLPFGLEWLGL